jgi:hypothetical protein
MATLHPTHHCFDDALDYISLRVTEEPSLVRDTGLVLVHGIGQSDRGDAYAHAWVEEGALCWDAALLDSGERVFYAVDHAEFYAARRLQQTTRYTCRQALRENLRTGTYGPWRAEYQALCSASRRVLESIAADASGASVRVVPSMTEP